VPARLGGETVYTVHYTKQVLTLTARCGYAMYADRDGPRGNVEAQGADLAFEPGCSAPNPAVFSLGDGVDGSAAGSPDMDPVTAPTVSAPRRSATPPSRYARAWPSGLAVCLTTWYPAARARGDKWRLVLLLVTGVADDGSVAVAVSAWDPSS
jgi:hypothetical protein